MRIVVTPHRRHRVTGRPGAFAGGRPARASGSLDLDSLRHGLVRVPAAIDYPQPWVDPRDIGDIAAVRLLYGGWSGRHVQAVHGPEDPT